MDFLQGLLGMGCSLAFIYWRRKIYDFTGPLDFAERYVTGTVTFYALLGLLGIVVSIMWMFGGIQSFIVEKGAQFL